MESIAFEPLYQLIKGILNTNLIVLSDDIVLLIVKWTQANDNVIAIINHKIFKFTWTKGYVGVCDFIVDVYCENIYKILIYRSNVGCGVVLIDNIILYNKHNSNYGLINIHEEAFNGDSVFISDGKFKSC